MTVSAPNRNAPSRTALAAQEGQLFRTAPPIDWSVSDALVPYPEALEAMDQRVTAIANGDAAECIWLLEHPPLYTAGTSAKPGDLRDAARFDVYKTGRGGQYTYHGPGQRIAYVMVNLQTRGRDVRAFVSALESWIIDTLGHFAVCGERREDRVGVWVRRPKRPPLPDGSPAEDKVAALGIRVRKGITLHGISINVEPDLEHFSGIVPCGVADHGVTSLVDLGVPVTMADVDIALRQEAARIFGPTVRAEAPSAAKAVAGSES
ncbi:MAG: lipoyl(octanoyl) transferase LipB [Devosiaceae bacterium]|nr:lipoyl(octanoyl) transferase LipB [Devosiaceae bacterium MH13]